MEKVVMLTARTETGYCCSCDILPGWVVTGSDNFEIFKKEVQESIDFYVDCAKEDGDEYPAVFDGEYEMVYKFDVRCLLEYYRERGIFTFSALEKITGINQKQLAHYASGRSVPRPEQTRKIANGLHQLADTLLTVTV